MADDRDWCAIVDVVVVDVTAAVGAVITVTAVTAGIMTVSYA